MSTLYDVERTAERLTLSEQQVRYLCRSGKLPAQQIGKTWIINEHDVSKYLETNSCGSEADQPAKETAKQDGFITLSFFSGAMGLDTGLEKEGFDIRLACEVDNACRKTIHRNRPNIGLIGDIEEYSPIMIKMMAGLSSDEDIDLIVGGPPCQAFSTAGKRQGFRDKRGNLFLSYLNIITTLRPKYAVIENVRGLLSAPLIHRPLSERGPGYPPLSEDEKPGGALKHILSVLEKDGYGVSYNLYNTANFGTPQKRERLIIICSRDGSKAPFLYPTHSETGSFGLPRWKTLRDAIGTLGNMSHTYIKFPEKRMKYYKLLSQGQNWRNLPVDVQKEAMGGSFTSGGGKTGFFRRLAWDEPSPTLVTHPAMPATDLCHPTELRPLSIEEYKHIQEFPEDWTIEGSIVEQYRQIGNAVPHSMGRAIGRHIKKLLFNEQISSIPNFPYSRYKNTAYQ